MSPRQPEFDRRCQGSLLAVSSRAHHAKKTAPDLRACMGGGDRRSRETGAFASPVPVPPGRQDEYGHVGPWWCFMLAAKSHSRCDLHHKSSELEFLHQPSGLRIENSPVHARIPVLSQRLNKWGRNDSHLLPPDTGLSASRNDGMRQAIPAGLSEKPAGAADRGKAG